MIVISFCIIVVNEEEVKLKYLFFKIFFFKCGFCIYILLFVVKEVVNKK